MRTTLRSTFASLRDDDRGIALVAVMGVIAVMTIIAVSAYVFSSQTLHETENVQNQTQAFQAANAGVDRALTRIQENGFLDGDYPLNGNMTGGESYVASVSPTGNSEYLCISTGTDPSSGRTETIKVKFFYLNMWNMNLAGGTNNALGGGAVRGTTSVYGPFYVRGGVTLGSNSVIENGPLFIKGGDLTLTGSGALGAPGRPVDVYVTGAYPAAGSRNMYARTISQSVPDISLPVLDSAVMSQDYNQAKAQSMDNVQGYPDSGITNLESTGAPSSYVSMLSGWTRPKAAGASTFYKAVGTDAGIGALAAGTHGLTIGGTGSFGSWSGDGHYTLTSHDDFSYDDVSNVLTVEGTVFIDGPLTLNDSMVYRGNGALVCNGDITMNGDFVPQTGDGHPDATHCVGLVTPGSIICNAGDSNTKDPEGLPDVAGAFFASRDWSMSKNVLVKGSVLAGSITFAHSNQHLVTDPDLPSYLPRAMPGSGNSILTKGSWVR